MGGSDFKVDKQSMYPKLMEKCHQLMMRYQTIKGCLIGCSCIVWLRIRFKVMVTVRLEGKVDLITRGACGPGKATAYEFEKWSPCHYCRHLIPE